MYDSVRGPKLPTVRQMDLRESCCVQPCRSHHYWGEGGGECTGVNVQANALQENDGIRSARFLEGLYNRARAAGNIGAAMSSNLCLITNTSQ